MNAFFAKGTAVIAAVAVGLVAACVSAAEPAQSKLGPDPVVFQKTVARGIDFLAGSQGTDGSWSPQTGVGVTALAAVALLRNGKSLNDPMVAKALKFLEGRVHRDGGIYSPRLDYHNYETCVAILCFTEANKDRRYDKLLKAAEKFVRKTQWSEAEGKDRSDPFYGGAGYGREKRPDLGNTGFLVEALVTCGAGPKDEAIQRALVFVSRCQNLEGEHNTTPFAAKINDGGFYYTCAGDGGSTAGKTPEGGLRSYGAMTYEGLKSMLYAGVQANDPRVKAATQWARQHYTLSSNPGLGADGLYYYYHVFAKAMTAAKCQRFEDAKGVAHDWRRELVAQLATRQRPNGSWLNGQSRWLESDPNLVTGYALMALAYCRQ